MSIKNKVAIVTAAASGIGRMIAERFAAEGAKLVISDIDEAGVRKLGEALSNKGAEVLALKCNVGQTADIDNMFAKIDEKFKTVDILINTVGIEGPTAPITAIEPKVFEDVMRINVTSMFYMMQKAAPYMIEQKSGKIVNYSSVAGKDPLQLRSPYCASKMAIIGLTRCVAVELGKHNITANVICPAMVEGDRFFGVMEKQANARNMPFEQLKMMAASGLPLQRFVKPEDVVELTLFLSDEEKSNSITAQDINIDCGFRSF